MTRIDGHSISGWFVLFGSLLIMLGVSLNIALNLLPRRRRSRMLDGWGTKDLIVFYLVNVGMTGTAIGLFWIVTDFRL